MTGHLTEFFNSDDALFDVLREYHTSDSMFVFDPQMVFIEEPTELDFDEVGFQPEGEEGNWYRVSRDEDGNFVNERMEWTITDVQERNNVNREIAQQHLLAAYQELKNEYEELNQENVEDVALYDDESGELIRQNSLADLFKGSGIGTLSLSVTDDGRIHLQDTGAGKKEVFDLVIDDGISGHLTPLTQDILERVQVIPNQLQKPGLLQQKGQEISKPIQM
jgi:hypothetical protein